MRARKHSSLLVLLMIIAALPLCLASCGGGGSDSGGSSGTGYNITITATSTLVGNGGQVTFIIRVTENGSPVPDGEAVGMSSSLGGSFTGPNDGDITTSGGAATAIYTAPAETTGNDQVTASYKGAYAYIYIRVVSN